MIALARDPRDLGAWRALCECIEDWLAGSGPPSRRRSSIRTDEVPAEHRWLLATPLRKRAGYVEAEKDPDGNQVPARVGHPCGLTQAQARQVERVRREYRLVVWGRAPGEGWSLCRGHGGRIVWRERLAELERLQREGGR